MSKKKKQDKPSKGKDKSAKKDKGKGGKNAFSKGYKPKPPKKLDGVHQLECIGAVEKETKSGRAVVIECKVIGEKIKFNHYINYQSKTDTAMALAHAQIETLCEGAGIDLPGNEKKAVKLFVEEIAGHEFYANLKTSTTDGGYTNYSIKKVIPDSEVDDD